MKVDQNFSASFNICREANANKTFSRKEMYNLLTESVNGMPKQDYIITIFVKNKALIKMGEGKSSKYKFTSNPVHISVLSQSIFEFKDIVYKQQRKYLDKKKKSKVVETKKEEVITATPLTEEYCIKYLKERGYKVMKQVTTFEEV